MHVCCGPCACMPIKRLADAGYEISCYFHNPNVQPLSEYLKRREAAAQCAAFYGLPAIFDDAWDIAGWLAWQLPRADSPARCEACCAARLKAACEKAAELGIRRVSTSLLYSRYQPHDFIAVEGRRLALSYGLEFIYRDFREDWQAGIDLSREMGLYRQAWCGCVFSEAERYAKKLRRLQADFA